MSHTRLLLKLMWTGDWILLSSLNYTQKNAIKPARGAYLINIYIKMYACARRHTLPKYHPIKSDQSQSCLYAFLLSPSHLFYFLPTQRWLYFRATLKCSDIRDCFFLLEDQCTYTRTWWDEWAINFWHKHRLYDLLLIHPQDCCCCWHGNMCLFCHLHGRRQTSEKQRSWHDAVNSQASKHFSFLTILSFKVFMLSVIREL